MLAIAASIDADNTSKVGATPYSGAAVGAGVAVSFPVGEAVTISVTVGEAVADGVELVDDGWLVSEALEHPAASVSATSKKAVATRP